MQIEASSAVRTIALALLLVLAIAGPAAADHHEAAPEMSAEEAAMMAAMEKARTPGPQHAMLAETVGEWNLEVKMWMDPAAEPMVSRSTATRKMILGGRVQVEEVVGDMMGEPFHGTGMTGYDNLTGEYWGTWVDDASTGLLIGRGTYDEASKTLTMTGEFVDPMTGEKGVNRNVIHYKDDGSEVMEYLEERGDDRGFVKVMEIVYTRK